jgi:hypothetical protein
MIEPTCTLVLTAPIKFGDEVIESLDLTEPTMGQLRAAHREPYDLDKLAKLIHLNATIPMSVVDKMTKRDVEACDRFFDRFKLPPDLKPDAPAQP